VTRCGLRNDCSIFVYNINYYADKILYYQCFAEDDVHDIATTVLLLKRLLTDVERSDSDNDCSINVNVPVYATIVARSGTGAI
jgi:hypothetical protein